MSEKVETTIKLDERTALLLKMVGEVYVRRGGPVWECAQEWDEAFTPEELDRLADSIEEAVVGIAPENVAP
ncbi:hypothetical protein D3C71_496880 [compost metagenome]